ncbi:unnamed protein product [Danaus chrysippus]|uniref:(African queen) hypothetical protein n=1 Tax=Danaus chrysippus TaxID=151541 RepID=A0A8J2QNG7_9NEOP|nr:unnamed protein product [Danaus chrysippus]
MLLSQHPPKMGWSGAVVSCCWYKKQLRSPPPVRTASNISDVAQLVYRLDWIGLDLIIEYVLWKSELLFTDGDGLLKRSFW